MTTQKEKPNTMLVTFDAELAQYYLDKYNTNNYRKINTRTVDAYAKKMRDGEWFPSQSYITIDTNNVLINGQHRLAAMVKVGIEVESFVTTQAHPDSIYVADSHMPRGMHDHCQCAKYLVTAVNTLLRSTNMHSSKAKNIPFFKEHIDGRLGSFATKMHKIYGKYNDPFTSWGIRGALLVAVLNGEMTQTAALDLFRKLVMMRKDNGRHMYASSIRAAVMADFPPLMTKLVDYLDDGKLPFWDNQKGSWVERSYDEPRDKAQKLMQAMSQCLSRHTMNDTEFAKPMQVNVKQALGL